MVTSISCSHLFVLDQDAALDFSVGVLGMEVHTDADLGFMRWLTVNVPSEPGRQILLKNPGPPTMDAATAEQARELLTKGAEFTSEPTEQPYGIDFGLRDPFGNHIRIGQLA
jgi:catechol 2,3-dioxygenase-like lactoylglutathione lyase family enzyme